VPLSSQKNRPISRSKTFRLQLHVRHSRSPRMPPRRSFTYARDVLRRHPHPRSRRAPSPVTPAAHDATSSISRARSACCRPSWTNRSRSACGPLASAGCAGRSSSSRRGQASPSPSRWRCRGRSVSALLASLMPSSRRCLRSAIECACFPPRRSGALCLTSSHPL